jgi:methylated-DNA-[protein]-cysteine S-methyltransferase
MDNSLYLCNNIITEGEQRMTTDSSPKNQKVVLTPVNVSQLYDRRMIYMTETSDKSSRYYHTYQINGTDITVISDGDNITGLRLGKVDVANATDAELDIFKTCYLELTEYFAGKRRSFDVPIKLEGSDYQKKVWQLVSEIPYGKTVTYKDLSLALGKKKAFRAVGGAVGKNPVLIMIPCHRVVGLDGSLTGYAGGTEAKKKLLHLEQAI